MKPEVANITIDKLVFGGDGLGRLETGEAVFVPFAAPGDRLQVALDRSRKKRLQGQVCSVEQPADTRTEPPCSVFGQCGGCQWQHLSGEAQHLWKQKIVEESLVRIGKLHEVSVQPVQGADMWFYRNKAEWLVIPMQQHIRLGYSKRNSHQGIPFDRCWIIPDLLNTLARFIEQHAPVIKGLHRVQARINTRGEFLLVWIGKDHVQQDILEGFLPQLTQTFPQIRGIVLLEPQGETLLWGEPYLQETIAGYTFRISSRSFFQVNHAVVTQLLKTVAEGLIQPVSTLLDVYAGGGLFSVMMNRLAGSITAVESADSAIADARANIALNGIQNIHLRQGPVEKVLPELHQSFDVAIMDPPRAGCSAAVLHWLCENIKRQLVYVSCDPVTLSRDLSLLVQNGWTIRQVQPFDMFPQTYHVETVVFLQRK